MSRRGLSLDKRGRLKLTEADVTKQIIGRLRADGFTCLKLDVGVDARSGLPYGEKGMADWLIVFERRCAFVELKAPGEKPKKHQDLWLDGALMRGHYVNWWDSYNWPDGKRPFLQDYKDLRESLGRDR